MSADDAWVDPVNILLVDDSPANLLALKAILEDPRYQLLAAGSGEEAMKIALRHKLTVILLDVVMPGMDGFEVARHLKQLERTRSIPILFLTAVATSVQYIYEAYEVGAADYLVKPLDAEVVRRKVAVFVEMVRQREEIARQARILREIERRECELRLAELRVASDTRYRKLVEGIDHAVAWTADQSGRLTFVSRQASRILGYSLQEFLEPEFWAMHLYPDDRETVLAQFRKSLIGRADALCDHRMVAADGRVLWFHTGVSGEKNACGSLELHGISIDVTDIKRAEETQTFLAEVGGILSESLDYRTTLPKVAKRIVPHLADWCLIDEVSGHGGIRALAAAHAEPGQDLWVRGMPRRRDVDIHASVGVAHVLRTARPELYGEVRDIDWLADALAAEPSDMLRTLGAVSCAFVPIAAHDRVLGVLTLVSSSSGRRFGASDLAVAAEVCHRIGLAVSNARLYEDAQRTSRAREDLLAVVSHDLRNPLSSIMTSAAIVERAAEHAQQDRSHESAQIILRAARRMDRLVGDLLDFAQIQAGRLAIDRQTVDAGSVIGESMEMFRPLAAEKELYLEGTASEVLLMSADRGRVLQVLSNLVGNAIKFTPKGGRVVVRADRVEEQARFAIADTGPGMQEEELSQIGARFWQARKTADGGVGLGLSIAKGLVEAHGGRIWAESKVGAGTTFYFLLPLVPDGSIQSAPPGEAESSLSETKSSPSEGKPLPSERKPPPSEGKPLPSEPSPNESEPPQGEPEPPSSGHEPPPSEA